MFCIRQRPLYHKDHKFLISEDQVLKIILYVLYMNIYNSLSFVAHSVCNNTVTFTVIHYLTVFKLFFLSVP